MIQNIFFMDNSGCFPIGNIFTIFTKGINNMMYNIKKLALAAVATLTLIACSESNRSTDWYMQNTLEQGKDLEECNRKSELKGTPNCVNANKAELIIQQGTDAIKEYRASISL